MNEIKSPSSYFERPDILNVLLLIINSVLFLLKLYIGFLSNSIALQADAYDSLKDLVMAVAALIGILYSNKKPNEKFPYGYYRIENIISLIISILIFFTAYTIFQQAIAEISLFFTGMARRINPSPLFIGFLVISLAISLLLTYYLKHVGKKTNSPIIQAQGREKLFDNLISSSVLIGFIGALFNIYYLDSIIGLIIGGFIIKGGYDIFINSTKTLLDAVIDFENKKELYEMIEGFPRVNTMEHFEIRSYGKYLFLEVDITLNQDLPLSKIEKLKRKISDDIRKKFPIIFKVVILTHAQSIRKVKIASPVSQNNSLNSEIASHFGDAPYFAFMEIENTGLSKIEIISNKYVHLEKQKGIQISDWLCSEKIDKLYLKKELQRGPLVIFENSLIEVVITNAETLKEILEMERDLLKNK